MIRRLLLFGVIAAFLLLLRRVIRGAGRVNPRNRRSGSVGSPGKLVRDRVCNTFVPKETALSLTEAGQVHYFCSQDCRQRYLDGSNGSSASAMAF